MKLVVDTDVIAAALLGEPGTADASARVIAGSWALSAPAFWKAELCNVLWKAVRRGRVGAEEAAELLAVAESLPLESVEVSSLWCGALGRALQADHPAYDALFVELAARLGTVVASWDTALARKFPGLVERPDEILRETGG